MSDAIAKYSQQLRRLVDEYYHQQITLDDYRVQRKLIFDHIEMEFTGDKNSSELGGTASVDESTFLY